MYEAIFNAMQELLRETYEGARPGEGTQYLDHTSGLIPTLSRLTAEQASVRAGNHPSIASHVRHMIFHLRVSHEWVMGDHSRRDWKGSFEPQTVTATEWKQLLAELESTRQDFLRAMKSLPPETFVAEGAGMGSIAHLAYHLGALRQRLPEA